MRCAALALILVAACSTPAAELDEESHAAGAVRHAADGEREVSAGVVWMEPSSGGLRFVGYRSPEGANRYCLVRRCAPEFP